MNIIFWQNIPSFHQSATIRALASIHGCEVTLAYQNDLSTEFQNGGWFMPDFGKTRLFRPANNDDILNLISSFGNNAVHIFSGIRFPMVRQAFLAAVKTESQIGLLAEAADWRGLKGLARLFIYRAESLRFRSRIDFIFAIGQLGVDWYSRCGFPTTKIYPYIYVVEKPTSVIYPPPTNKAVRLIFVGQCIRRKGLDLLITALIEHQSKDWHLDIVGNGSESDNLMRLSKKQGLSEKITFNGALRNDVAREMIAQSDCLILPSRWDGWGAVVNEALMQGVPVICSDACGAADLLGNSERGEVFKAGSIPDLKRVLGSWICKGKKTQESTKSIKTWARSIEGVTVAGYLLDVINVAERGKDKPHVPWHNGVYPCV